MPSNTTKFIASYALLLGVTASFAQNPCTATSGPTITPVVELYTSEGCSSCPPADKWASSLKDKGVVVQAFHVGYWDYIGWVDRFAAPAYTQRQREVAARNSQRNVYTPQAVLDGKDWTNWGGKQPASTSPARASITVRQLGPDTGLKLTTARYYTPNGNSIQAKGIVPEVMVDGDKWAVVRARPSYEDVIGLDIVPPWLGGR